MMNARWLTPMLAFALAACSMPREHAEPGLAMPDAWDTVAPATMPASDEDWWHALGGSALTGLIAAAQSGNPDLAASIARIRQAQAQARIAGASLLPELGAQAAAGRSREEGASATAYFAGLAASYELDLWGANSAARDAALATLDASEFGRDVVGLTLAAGVASTWFDVLSLRERVVIARHNLAASERMLGLVESRYRAGMATALEPAQQRGLVAAQRQIVAERQQQERDSLTALALLLGRAPQGFDIPGTSLAGVAAPAVSSGVPSALLTRRPDLAQAERRLRAADANISVARAAMLPKLTLTAGLGLEHDRMTGFFDNPLYHLAGGLAAPIFNAGRLAAGRDLSIAQRDEVLADYRRAIVAALADVQVALTAIDGLDQQRAAQDQVLVQAQAAFRLAESRYRAGSETLLAALDAQRTLFAAQDEAAQLAARRLQASVALYKALGGGWAPQPDGQETPSI